eukprot:11408495-Prorocentrum_lima.AAC.1
MTSSLVGSEMCIRDREDPSRRGPRPVKPHSRQHTAQQSCGARAPGDIPVSYTHLTLPTICSV